MRISKERRGWQVSPALFGLMILLLLQSCTGNDSDNQPTADPEDSEAPLSNLDDLLEGAPPNSEIPSDGKYDAVYPQTFDLAATQSPVRSQGRRGVCSIFSTVALMEHLYIREGTITNPDFSEQFLQWSVKNEVGSFQNTSGSNARSNLQAINQYGIVQEDVWPYEANPWNESNDPGCTGDNQPTQCYTNGNPPDEVLQAQRFTLPRGRWVNSSRDSIRAFLTENGSGVIAGMTFFYQSWNHRGSDLPVNREYWSEGYVLYPNERDRELSLEDRAGHSILLIGWDDNLEVQTVDENGELVTDEQGNPVMERGFFLFKNSWGTSGFGIRNPFGPGYGWISMRYVEEYASIYGSGEPDVDFSEDCDDGIDNDYDNSIDCDDSDCTDDVACRQSGLEFSTEPGVAIPDNSPDNGVQSTIDIEQPGTIGSLFVTVNITHSYIGDLKVTLSNPAGTEVTLHNKEGGSEDNIHQTYTVTNFDGLNLAGTWTLEVTDSANQDTGTLDSWSMEVILSGDIPQEICDDGLDNDGNGNADCADEACVGDSACATSQQITQTNETATPIPDFTSDSQVSPLESTIEITESGIISSFAVEVDITHTYRGDLTVALRHPNGTEINLHDRSGSGEDDLIRRYSRTDFNGLPSTGVWTLIVADHAQMDTGTLNSWTLDMEVLPAE